MPFPQGGTAFGRACALSCAAAGAATPATKNKTTKTSVLRIDGSIPASFLCALRSAPSASSASSASLCVAVQSPRGIPSVAKRRTPTSQSLFDKLDEPEAPGSGAREAAIRSTVLAGGGGGGAGTTDNVALHEAAQS